MARVFSGLESTTSKPAPSMYEYTPYQTLEDSRTILESGSSLARNIRREWWVVSLFILVSSVRLPSPSRTATCM